MILRNHYETLGINKGCTDDDVRKSYHRLAKLYHPDKNKDTRAEDKFKEIGQAYDVMKSKDRRELWEREFARQQQTLREQKNDTNKVRQNHDTNKTHQKHDKNKTRQTRSATAKSHQKRSETRQKTTKKQQKETKRDFTYAYFFTDSDIEEETPDFDEKNEKNRRQSYAGPFDTSSQKSKDTFIDREKTKQSESEKENFTFGFNIYMDSQQGFQSYFDPFHMYYDWEEKPHRFRDFSGDEEEFVESFKASHQNKKKTAKECAGKDGDQDWYDWTRAFQPMASSARSYSRESIRIDEGEAGRLGMIKYSARKAKTESLKEDEDGDGKLSCSYCRKLMPGDMLRKHEARCRRLSGGQERRISGGPDILAFQRRHSDLNERRRRTSLQQEQMSNLQKDDLVTCMYCYRKFNQKAADKHIAFCSKQTMQTGRPMNPLGKSAAARDYSSKNYTAKEYAKTVPKPKATPPQLPQRRKTSTQSPADDLEKDEDQNQSHTEGNETNGAQTLNNGRRNSISTMNYPSATRTGLHPSVNKIDPKQRRSSLGSKSKPNLIDVNIPPPLTKFTSGAPDMTSYTSEGCSTCQRQYGLNTSTFTCSCGVKKSLPTQ